MRIKEMGDVDGGVVIVSFGIMKIFEEEGRLYGIGEKLKDGN